MKSVILAAGQGARFKNQGISLPKPLIKFGGITLLERTIHSAAKAGVDEFFIVLGDLAKQIEEVMSKKIQHIKITYIYNPKWEAGNGSSLLAAEPYLKEESLFLVQMSDHLVFPNTIKGLIETSRTQTGATIAVDFKHGLLADEGDASKVKVMGQDIVEIGKNLQDFDGFDVGVSVCTPQVFEELSQAFSKTGQCQHLDGMRGLASQKQLKVYDIGDDRWEDVDDPASYKVAEELLYQSLRKKTDGFMSRHLERRISLSITRLLADTPVAPNHMTVFVMLLGAVAACLFAVPQYWFQVSGALLFWACSFLDGCDGELARLKFQESRLGGWLDLWSDNVIHSMVFGGIGVGLYRSTGNPQWILLSSFAVLGVFLSVSLLSFTIARERKNFGPLFVSTGGGNSGKDAAAGVSRLITFADALGRRDFIFGLIFICLFNLQPLFLWMTAIGTNLYFLTVLFIQWSLHTNRA